MPPRKINLVEAADQKIKKVFDPHIAGGSATLRGYRLAASCAPNNALKRTVRTKLRSGIPDAIWRHDLP